MSTITQGTPGTHTGDPESPAAMASAPQLRRVARLAGASYLSMFVLAIAANFVVLEGLVVEGDPLATTANIADSPGLMRAGILAFLVIVLLDITLASALRVVFRSVNRHLSTVMAWFRLVYSVMLGLAVVFLVQALVAATASPSSVDAQAVQTMQAIDSFQTIWMLGLSLFGVHLVLLGVLVAASGFAPRVLGFVLVIAGLAYVADTVAHLTLADYSAVSALFLVLVAVPSMIAEGWLGVWLLTTRRLRAA